MTRVISGEIDLLYSDSDPVGDADSGPLGAFDWYVGETRQGWRGWVTLFPSTVENLSTKEVFEAVFDTGLVPDRPVRFGMWLRPASTYSFLPVKRDAEVNHLRSWPSVVSKIECNTDSSAMVFFSDPVTHLLKVPIWGIFKHCTVGELLAGGMLLAAGVDQAPSLQPAIPALPDIVITEPEGIEQIPYAIATGETLGYWLGSIFGRLGIRMELLGNEASVVHVSLLIEQPTGVPVDLKLETRDPSSAGAVMSSFGASLGPSSQERNTLIDNPSIGQPRQVGSAPTFEQVYTSAELTLDEAMARLGRTGDNSELNLSQISIVTRQSGLHPGRIVQFDKTITGADQWQVHAISHAAGSGRYRNEAYLMKLGIWTPLAPPDRGPITISGIIHKSDAAPDQEVARDSLGRVPVRLCIDLDENDRELLLPVINPMAGGLHGFVPDHRQGDVCRVVVHHPMTAEIVGFSYADHRRIAENVIDVSMGMVVGHHSERWSGLVFRPGAEVEEEERELEQTQ